MKFQDLIDSKTYYTISPILYPETKLTNRVTFDTSKFYAYMQSIGVEATGLGLTKKAFSTESKEGQEIWIPRKIGGQDHLASYRFPLSFLSTVMSNKSDGVSMLLYTHSENDENNSYKMTFDEVSNDTFTIKGSNGKYLSVNSETLEVGLSNTGSSNRTSVWKFNPVQLEVPHAIFDYSALPDLLGNVARYNHNGSRVLTYSLSTKAPNYYVLKYLFYTNSNVWVTGDRYNSDIGRFRFGGNSDNNPPCIERASEDLIHQGVVFKSAFWQQIDSNTMRYIDIGSNFGQDKRVPEKGNTTTVPSINSTTQYFSPIGSTDGQILIMGKVGSESCIPYDKDRAIGDGLQGTDNGIYWTEIQSESSTSLDVYTWPRDKYIRFKFSL